MDTHQYEMLHTIEVCVKNVTIKNAKSSGFFSLLKAWIIICGHKQKKDKKHNLNLFLY